MYGHDRWDPTVKRLLLAAAAAVLASGLLGSAPSHAEPVGDVSRQAPSVEPPTRAAPADPHAPVGGTVGGLTGNEARRATAAAGEAFALARGERNGSGGIGIEAANHANWGVNARAVPVGAMATQTIDPKLVVSVPGELLYTPTLLAAKTACFEVTTIYSGGSLKLGAWDWCDADSDFDKVVIVDATFLATYTTTVNGRPAYTVKVEQVDAAANTWTGYLYNYSTGVWDVFYTSSGTTRLSTTFSGWDVWELYSNKDPNTGNGYYCADSRGFTWESSNIQWSFASGIWELSTDANSEVYPSPPPMSWYTCPTLTFTVASANDDFQVTNSPAPSGQVRSASGMCMEVNAGSSADGAKIQIWTCYNNPPIAWQIWTFPGDGTLRVNGKCLDVANSGTANGTKVQLWGCNGTGAQRWTHNPTTGAFTNPQSGKCLDIPSNSTTKGTQLQIYTCNGSAAQRWTAPV